MASSKLGRGIHQETEQEEIVTIGDIERRGGLLLRGNPRTGKTTLLVDLIVQDIEHGHGLMVIDPHGDAIDDILKRLPCREEDVIFFDPFDKEHTFGLNLFECDRTDRRQVSRTVNYMLHMFAKLFTEKGDLAKEAPTMDETMQHTAELIIDNQEYLIDGNPLGMTMAEIPWIFNYEDARARLTPQLTDDHEQAREFWREYEISKRDEKNETVASTKRRISKFLSDPHIKHIIGQGKSTINFREIIDNKKILLVKLTREDEQLTNFIGSILIGKLLNTVYADTTPEHKRTDFSLYCDEFQNFATPEFAKLFTETGKWHIMPTVSNQVGSLLEHTIRGAIATAAIKVLYQLTENDANEFAPELARKPTPVEPREEEQKAVYLNPVEWFRQGKGHTNARVVDLVAKLINPLFASDEIGRFTIPTISPYFEAERPPRYERKQIIDLLNNINRFLVHAMRGESKSLPPLLTDILWECWVLKLTNVEKQWMSKQWMSKQPYLGIDESIRLKDRYERNLLRISLGNLQQISISDYLELIDSQDLDLFHLYGNTTKLHLEYPTEQDMDEAITAFIASYQDNGYFPNEAIAALRKARFYYHLKKLYVLAELEVRKYIDESGKIANSTERINVPSTQSEICRFMEELERERRISDRHRFDSTYQPALKTEGRQDYEASLREILDRNCTDQVAIDRRKKAWKQAIQDGEKIAELITEWIDLAQLLQAEPIKERTGQQVFVPGIQRTFADMVEEMKHELVNLPRHTAYCKLTQEIQGRQMVGKYKLYPYPLRQADSEAVYQKRLDRIIQQTQYHYCSPRTEVEAEIKARKDALIAPLQRKPQANTGDKGNELTRKLAKIKAELGNEDFNLFYNDRRVQEKDTLKRLLEKALDANKIRSALEEWRAAGSPADVSPFAELIKKLLG